MSQNRDDHGQFTEKVSLSDVLDVFDAVEGPVVTSGDVASETSCSGDSARRKLERLYDQGRLGRRKAAGRIVYWRLDAVDPTPVHPDDPIFTERRSFASGTDDLSDRVDELLYVAKPGDAPAEPEGEANGETPHRAAARAFLDRVRDDLEPDSIAELWLFGSVVRDEADTDSDVDVLAVISDEADYATVDDRLLDIAYDVQLEYGVRIEVHAIEAEEFEARKERGDPFVRSIIEGAKPVSLDQTADFLETMGTPVGSDDFAE